MNDELQTFSRGWLSENLSKLPEGHQRLFKLMYGRYDLRTKPSTLRTVPETEALSIHEVCAEMEPEKLDWAMTQVENSLKKLDIK